MAKLQIKTIINFSYVEDSESRKSYENGVTFNKNYLMSDKWLLEFSIFHGHLHSFINRIRIIENETSKVIIEKNDIKHTTIFQLLPLVELLLKDYLVDNDYINYSLISSNYDNQFKQFVQLSNSSLALPATLIQLGLLLELFKTDLSAKLND